MISLSMAKALQSAGLPWNPVKNDFFAVPDRGLDDIVFVISDMTVMLSKIQGHLAMTFHGAVEWALDYVFFAELVWLPTEGQMRAILEQHLIREPQPTLVLMSTADGYRCKIQFRSEVLSFDAFGASDAYGLALLHILEQANSEE